MAIDSSGSLQVIERPRLIYLLSWILLVFAARKWNLRVACKSLEKSRLSRRISGIAKVAQPNANQTKALLCGQAHSVP